MDYNQHNSHPRDRLIHFDAEAHSYTAVGDDGSSVPCESVTTVVENLFEKFDADYWANLKATPWHTAEQIKAEWNRKGEIARTLGTELHDRIERHYLGEEPSPEALADRAFCHFLEFARTTHLNPFRSEWRIFSARYRIAGTLDFLACTGGRYEIYDWKRSAKLIGHDGQPLTHDRFGKHAYAPVEHIPDTTYHHYAIQVSLYRLILELEYGIEVADGHLGTFHPDYMRPYVIDLPYLRDEAWAILNSRL